ncbi:GyrI-like domain-containing protein [Actinomadura fibrosa]|uniref:GyrI-like domain-containing protein n=1 Tax=Actinomadura fibrosa TaxID=111802 RepID=A0ABW2XCE3_9ACTN|nr:GyrI-like domain-containing protein [Actinomadura fibrosa]
MGALFAVLGALGAPMVPLEGRWWIEDERSPFEVPREEWWWHLFVRLPDETEPGAVDRAREEVRPGVPAAARVQEVMFTEGRCVQVMHHGAFADEPATLARMDALMRAEGLTVNGLHHEIYLTSPDETDPAKIRAILRQPVRPGRPVSGGSPFS